MKAARVFASFLQRKLRLMRRLLPDFSRQGNGPQQTRTAAGVSARPSGAGRPPLTGAMTGAVTGPTGGPPRGGGAADRAAKTLLALPPCEPPRCFIGDLHGRSDLLARLFAEIRNRDPEGRAEVIFLGDLIDRGPDSAGVLAAVRAFCAEAPARRHALMGNHERMLLDFLADPAGAGPRWLRHGGRETLASFGVLPRHGRDPAAEQRRLAEALRLALPPGLEAWLAARPLYWQDAELQAAHAGSDPDRPIHLQGEAELLWGRRPALARGPATRIELQGHIVVETAHLALNRVWLDTGAWQSGRLSALWLGAQAEWIGIEAPGAGAAAD